MVQYSQTSWQEYTLSNTLESMRYAPMNVTVGGSPIIHYTLPQNIEAGEEIRYSIVIGFRKISWKGIISSVVDNKILVRLGNGPFRGFNASHHFIDEGNMTGCYDEFSFQGFNEFTEESFAKVIDDAQIVYAIKSRKEAQEIYLEFESKKQTQGFSAILRSNTAG